MCSNIQSADNNHLPFLQEDFAMGACAGAFAAAATTPLDVIKTNMMCTAASRPTMMSAGRAVLAQGGPKYFFRCVIATAVLKVARLRLIGMSTVFCASSKEQAQ